MKTNNGKPFNKAQKNSHGSFEVKCGSCKHDIVRVSCYGPHPLVCLLHLGGAVLLASEALDQLQVFDFSSVALSDFQFFLSCYIATELDDLVQEFGVGWKGFQSTRFANLYKG